MFVLCLLKIGLVIGKVHTGQNNYSDCSIMINKETEEPKLFFHGVRRFQKGLKGSAMGSGITSTWLIYLQNFLHHIFQIKAMQHFIVDSLKTFQRILGLKDLFILFF